MRKLDELALWASLRESYRFGDRPVWPDFAEPLGICMKRCYSLLEKWQRNGWWESGVNPRWGWFTEHAPQQLTP